MYIEAFTTHFGELSDNRQSAKVTYPLEDILFITLCGVVVLTGCRLCTKAPKGSSHLPCVKR